MFKTIPSFQIFNFIYCFPRSMREREKLSKVIEQKHANPTKNENTELVEHKNMSSRFMFIHSSPAVN